MMNLDNYPKLKVELEFLDKLEKPLLGNLSYRYKNRSIDIHDFRVDKSETSAFPRVIGAISSVPMILENGAWDGDKNRLGEINIFYVCPTGCRIQTYSMREKWNITDYRYLINKDASLEDKDNALLESFSKMILFINMNDFRQDASYDQYKWHKLI